VLIIVENGAFELLFDINSGDNNVVQQVFNTLRLLIDVMPFILGFLILGTLLFGLAQAYQTKWKSLPTLSLIVYTIAINYNISFADKLDVEEAFKKPSNGQSIDKIRYATQGVMRQHHVQIIGFGFFLICQIAFIYQKSTNLKKY
jgi:hypothetical protein